LIATSFTAISESVTEMEKPAPRMTGAPVLIPYRDLKAKGVPYSPGSPS
jgi:hypothetical protein